MHDMTYSISEIIFFFSSYFTFFFYLFFWFFFSFRNTYFLDFRLIYLFQFAQIRERDNIDYNDPFNNILWDVWKQRQWWWWWWWCVGMQCWQFISNDVWHFNHFCSCIEVFLFFHSSNMLKLDGQNDDPHRITM